MKAYHPDLDPAILARLRDYAAVNDFPQAKPARWAGVHQHGLSTDGDRKSVEPLFHAVARPDGLTSKAQSMPSSSSSAKARKTRSPSAGTPASSTRRRATASAQSASLLTRAS